MPPISASPSLNPSDVSAGSSSARADLATEVHVDIDLPVQELFFRRELAKVVGRYSDRTENFRGFCCSKTVRYDVKNDMNN